MNALNSYDELSARGMGRSGRGGFFLCMEVTWKTWRCGCLHFVVHKTRISCYTSAGMWQKSVICFSKTTKEGTIMNYMICIPSPRLVSREYCERIHNILARMSDQYRVNIVPEPVKMRQGSCPDFYKKYRIYKDIKERDGNGEAYLTSEEENMILSVCRNPEEVELMKSCTYAYRYPTTLVLKSFREDKKR